MEQLVRTGQPASLFARLNHPTKTDASTFGVIGDPHLATRAGGTARRFELTEHWIKHTVADLHTRDLDFVASVGDLTKDGEPWNLERMGELVDDLSVPFITIPGNHDLGDGEPSAADLDRFTAQFPPGEIPFHRQLGGIDVIGLNTVYPDKQVSEQQLDWLDTTLESVDSPVVLAHHNIPAFTGQLATFKEQFDRGTGSAGGIENATALLDRLEDHDVRLLLTGHHHRPGLAVHDDVVEIASGALCIFPQSYFLVTVDDRGTTIRNVPILSRQGLAEAYRVQQQEGNAAKGQLAALDLSQLPIRDEWDDSYGG